MRGSREGGGEGRYSELPHKSQKTLGFSNSAQHLMLGHYKMAFRW